MRILGYADRLSVPAGEQVEFKISSALPEVTPTLVRLRRGGSPEHTLVEEPVAAELPGVVPGRLQVARAGSFVAAPVRGDATVDGVGLAAWICPRLLDEREQVVVSLGAVLAVTAGGAVVRDSTGRLLGRLDVPLVPNQWAFLAATVTPAGDVRVELHRPDREVVGANATTAPIAVARGGTVVVGGPIARGGGAPVDATAPGTAEQQGRSTAATSGGWAAAMPGHFNGRIARPVAATTAWAPADTARLAAGDEAVAVLGRAGVSALALGRDPAASTADDDGDLTGGATLVNRPAAAVPGPFWRATENDFRLVPAEYDALHFHEDDLDDAGWATDVTLRVPTALPSGAYALKLTAGDEVDRIPFVVTPAPDAPPAPVLVVLPTWTYLAYANWRTYAEYEPERVTLYGEARGVDPRDRWLAAHPELGRSLYDVHTDGSGVYHSSRARPIVNMRPDYFTPTTRGLRHFAQDLLLLEWLDRRGEDYAVITDDEVADRGVAVLTPHRVVLTGSHPEYFSAGMLDAYDAFTASGGRLMYLGGNGFYLVTGRHTNGTIEIRRGRGTRTAWAPGPGEEHLSVTGELGGLWRHRGRAPQRITGVGMTAQGFDFAVGYRRSPQSHGPDVNWVFDGVDGAEFGAEGPGLGGAAGDEIDRADPALGTPGDAVVLATSFGHSAKIALALDDLEITYAEPAPGIHPKVRSDVVIFGRAGGGAVFSVGSITWSNAMSHKDGDNDVARITGNVLDRFRDHPAPVGTT